MTQCRESLIRLQVGVGWVPLRPTCIGCEIARAFSQWIHVRCPAGIYGHAAVCWSGRVMSDSPQHNGPSADCRTKSQFTLYRTVTQLRETLRSVFR